MAVGEHQPQPTMTGPPVAANFAPKQTAKPRSQRPACPTRQGQKKSKPTGLRYWAFFFWGVLFYAAITAIRAPADIYAYASAR